MTPLQNEIFRLLAGGGFHSGEAMAISADVSRSAVWKAMQGLRAWGIPIHAVSGRGYCLPATLELLERSKIFAGLGADSKIRLPSFEVLLSVDSTNAWLMRLDKSHSVAGCVAEQQTAGRGRRGRLWFSPFGANLYLSLRYRFDDGMGGLAGLSLAVAVGVRRTLLELGIKDAALKWPNDIYWKGRKLGGILLEVTGESAGPCQLVIGVGLNVAMPPEAFAEVDQPWVDLATIQAGISRNWLAGRLLHHLLEVVPVFRSNGLSPFIREWQDADLLFDKPVVLLQSGAEIVGTGRGIATDGSLLLEVAGHLQHYSYGEVSSRLAEALE